MSLYIQTLLQNALGYIKSGELDEALNLIKRAQDSSPNNPDIFRLLSVIAALKFDYNNALELIDESIRFDPNNGVALSNKGNILKELRRHDEAIACFDEAIKLLPNYSEAYNNKANALQELHRYEDALVCYDKAITLQPNYVEAYHNKGNALDWLRRHDEAMESFNKATQIDPNYVDAYWQKARNQLANGNFEAGWQNYEARWSKSNPLIFQFSDLPRLEELTNLASKRVLVWAEQGLGDTLQFCRYIKPLYLSGAEVTFLVPKQLLVILNSLQKFCTLVSSLESCQTKFDFQTPLMSLPLLFGTTLNSVPCEVPYLIADESHKTIFEPLLTQSDSLKVGIVWSGGARLQHSDGYSDFQWRNMELDQIASLKEVQGIDFYSLQKGDPAESELLLRKDEVWPRLINCAHLLHDFADTAALVESLDLIISVDTSTAHLAGALAKPVWILNRYNSCWRWLRDRTDSPWYPTATVYQQSTPRNWVDVIEKVKFDLGILVNSHNKK